MDNFFYFVETLIQQRPLWSIPFVFLSGLAVSFTPCFYPLIPVILGIIGIDEDTSKKEALFVSLIFVLGLSLVYTALGIVSSLTGTLFGASFKNPLFQFIAAIILVIMGFILLDFIHIPVSFSLNFRPKGVRVLGVFVLGMISGLISGGCTFPVLGTILVLIAFNKNVSSGGLLLFTFSLGIGSMFIMVALLGGTFLEFFKKNTKVFVRVKKLLGVGILLFSLFFFIKGFSLL